MTSMCKLKQVTYLSLRPLVSLSVKWETISALWDVFYPWHLKWGVIWEIPYKMYLVVDGW
jgi:hypothetical protein